MSRKLTFRKFLISNDNGLLAVDVKGKRHFIRYLSESEMRASEDWLRIINIAPHLCRYEGIISDSVKMNVGGNNVTHESE